MAQVVTVFGGSGFVGKQVVRALAKAGWRVKVAVRKIDYAYDLKPLGDVGQIKVIRCDVRREAEIDRALEGSDAVVNLVGILYNTPSQSFDVIHRKAAATMAELAAKRGITKFVQMSAIGADVKSPSGYGRSKGQAEEAVRKVIPSAVVLRPSVIFGPGDGFFNMLATQAKLFPLLPAIDGAKTRFQPVYVGDVAAAVAKAISDPAAAGKTYELGGPKAYSFAELMTYVADEVMSPRFQVYLPFIAARLIAIAGDIQATVTPIAPLLTTDQLLMLKKDNVVTKGAKGFKDLGITSPVAVEGIVPGYMWRYRKGGQFAEATS
jgi:uncharacterized protein YbjT (DUF2867 family)